MPERCDFCKRGPLYNRYSAFKKGMKPPKEDMYETLDFKDTALSHYGDAAIICKTCADDLKKVLDKFWEDKTPPQYRCGCLERTLNIAYNQYRDKIEKRPDMLKYWKEGVEHNVKQIEACQKPEHAEYVKMKDNLECAQLIKEYLLPWQTNFQYRDPILADDNEESEDSEDED